MTRPPFVEANGACIPVLGLGTSPLRGETCSQAVQWALETGYRHIDTAANYGNEGDIGAGLKASGVAREEVFVTTKVWHSDLKPVDLWRSAEASLKRLGLSQVNLLLIHWPNSEIPLSETMSALNAVKRQRLTRHIGVANFSVPLLDEAVRLSSEPLAVNQCEYHPYLDQSRIRAACQKHGMAFASYSPLGGGALRSILLFERLHRSWAKALLS